MLTASNKKKKDNNLLELIQKDKKIIWRELSRLYDALEEKDVLLGIYEHVHVCAFSCIYIHIFISIFICIYQWVLASMNIYMYAYIHIRMHPRKLSRWCDDLKDEDV
jgi:hypothetical protein